MFLLGFHDRMNIDIGADQRSQKQNYRIVRNKSRQL